MQLIKILTNHVKAELTNELLNFINSSISTGVKYTKRNSFRKSAYRLRNQYCR